MNVGTVMGMVFFTIGILGFLASLITFDPSLHNSESMLHIAKFNNLILAIFILITNFAIGAFLFTLGKIQIAIESINRK